MIVLRFYMQGKNITDHTNGKCHVFAFLVCKRKILLMSSVIRVHFRQLVDHCVS